MNTKYPKRFPGSLIIGILLSLCISNLTYSQPVSRVFEDIGGGSGNTTTAVESNDNITLYVVGGIIVAGIVVYALLRDKKEKPSNDTTASILPNEYLTQNLSLTERVKNIQSQIPINISLGIQGNKAVKNERRYFVGLNYNF